MRRTRLSGVSSYTWLFISNNGGRLILAGVATVLVDSDTDAHIEDVVGVSEARSFL